MLTIIVPYRDRKEHLERFVERMQGFGNILVVEQADERPFNRGKLLNIGFLHRPEATTYVALHDVDMLPGEKADYTFPKVPTHICSTPLYPNFFGAVTLFSVEDFLRCNGFDNEFWGWGAEDDDLFRRVMESIGKFERRTCEFTVLPHQRVIQAPLYEKNCKRLGSQPKYFEEGLNNCHYEVTEKVVYELYTIMRVRL